MRQIQLDDKDYNFLKGLAERLNTQTNDHNADPVFWGIRDYQSVRDDADGEYIGILEDGEEIFMEHYEDSLNNLRNILSAYEDREKLNKMNLDDLIDFIENFGHDEDGNERFQIIRYNRLPFITDQTGCFLTKKAAQEHLENNHYHYSKDAHVYAMTAWRNPEFEILLDILKRFE